MSDQVGMIASTFSTRKSAAAMAYLMAQESGLSHGDSIDFALKAADRFDAEHRRIPDWMEEDAWDCSKCQTRHVRGYRVRLGEDA